MFDFNDLSYLVEDYVDGVNDIAAEENEDNPLSIDDLVLMMKCSDIILSCSDVKYKYKYKETYSLKQSDKFVEDFLKELNPKYLEHYRLLKENGVFIFDEKFEGNQPYWYYDFYDNKRMIYIPVTHTIDDSFSIVHELFHDINCGNGEYDSSGRDLFTEGISFLGEILLSDFLKSRNVIDVNDAILRRITDFKFKALETNFNLRLILEYLKNGYLDSYLVGNIFLSYPDKYRDDLFEIAIYMCYNEELTLEGEETYILSYLISIYMYYRIKENEKNINELFDLNQVLDDLSIDQVLNYLGVDHEDGLLTSGSYDVLRKGLIKFIKRR